MYHARTLNNGSGPLGVKKVRKQDDVKGTTEEEQQRDEKQQEECEELPENGNDAKVGSAEEDDSDEDGPQLPSGLTGKYGTACNLLNTVCGESQGNLGLACLVSNSFHWKK